MKQLFNGGFHISVKIDLQRLRRRGKKVLEGLYFSQNVIRREKVNDFINTYCLNESTSLFFHG